ncbi:thaumatin-like protein 1b [Canna indica]|uniref:Thaumatin-like protein 1b n=1 Tax=Canna indica TaxID=4628 RepID=A0AAQ3QJ65_9LILI|nr:thaumatin-like protein 1b [Canna indica]
MDHLLSPSCLVLVSVLLFLFFKGDCTTFTFVNKCDEIVWPGVLSNSGIPPLEATGFALPAGTSRTLLVPASWSGRFWARTGCNFDAAGRGFCATGDCGSGQVECNGAGAAPPATLVEFTLGGGGGADYYDVSLVDGYNLPVAVEAAGCAATGCAADLNQLCPEELRAWGGAACRSACDAFGRAEFCCSGEFASPSTCRPSAYSEVFKSACPQAYSYAFDDATSTFTCAGAQAYAITFCPVSSPSKKAMRNYPSPRAGIVLQDDSWLASLAIGEANPTRKRSVSLVFVVSVSVVVVTTLLFQFL